MTTRSMKELAADLQSALILLSKPNLSKRDIKGIYSIISLTKDVLETTPNLESLRATMVIWKGTWERETAVGPISERVKKMAIQILEGVISEIDGAQIA
ncbi:MAG: hypothetical protein JRM77_06920 [Nitrososphaerota archaeon]|nr:hypothetical protein [Nitrososphaerota archaeon]